MIVRTKNNTLNNRFLRTRFYHGDEWIFKVFLLEEDNKLGIFAHAKIKEFGDKNLQKVWEREKW